MGFGFSKAWVLEALANTNGDADRATDWLFSHDEPAVCWTIDCIELYYFYFYFSFYISDS
jgi:hypothetical protein